MGNTEDTGIFMCVPVRTRVLPAQRALCVNQYVLRTSMDNPLNSAQLPVTVKAVNTRMLRPFPFDHAEKNTALSPCVGRLQAGTSYCSCSLSRQGFRRSELQVNDQDVRSVLEEVETWQRPEWKK